MVWVKHRVPGAHLGSKRLVLLGLHQEAGKCKKSFQKE